MLELIVVLLLFIALFCRNGPLGWAIIAVAWICAGVFNPNIDSGTVWLIAFVAAAIPVLDE